MAFCRWSTDDFKCDLYCYEHVNGGYYTYIAGRRPIYKEPLPETVNLDNTKEFLKRYQKVMEMHKECDFEEITLPHVGETFIDETIEDFLKRLIYLKEVGYNFPDKVIEDIKEEIEELKNEINTD
jgi:hypothetical protein